MGRLGRSRVPAAPPAPLPADPALRRQKQSSSAARGVAGGTTPSFQMGTPSLHTPLYYVELGELCWWRADWPCLLSPSQRQDQKVSFMADPLTARPARK